jgi:hypothetical protein
MRVVPVVAGILAGFTIGGAALAGSCWGSQTSVVTEALHVRSYCQKHYGDRSAGHDAADRSGLLCSTRERGIWSLVPVKADDICREQLGRNASVVRTARGGRACHG